MHIKVTVNGRSVDQWIEEEQGQEIRRFYVAEVRLMKRTIAPHIVSANGTRNQSKVERIGNGSIRCA